MPESSQFAKNAACLALTAKVVDEEIARILLALNDSSFVCRLLADAASQGKKVTPEAWKTLSKGLPRQTLSARLFDAFNASLHKKNDRGAKTAAYLLTKLKVEKNETDAMLAEALGHGNLHIAVWILRRPTVEINRLLIYRWLKTNYGRATELSNEIVQQLEATKDGSGKQRYLENLAEDIRSIAADNEELRQAIALGEPDEIASILYNCLLVTNESREALEQFAWDNPERIPHLAELMQKDAKTVVEDGTTQAVGNFLRLFAQELMKHAEAAQTAARVGG